MEFFRCIFATVFLLESFIFLQEPAGQDCIIHYVTGKFNNTTDTRTSGSLSVSCLSFHAVACRLPWASTTSSIIKFNTRDELLPNHTVLAWLYQAGLLGSALVHIEVFFHTELSYRTSVNVL